MIEFLENDLPVQDIALSFIFCNHKASLSQTPEYFVGAIARQLVERKQTIPENVQALY